MKLFLLVVVFSMLAAGGGQIYTKAQTKARTKASNTGRVTGSNSNQSMPNPKSFDISKIDFKNFTFPDFTGGKTFTLKNGVAGNKDSLPKYTLRKTYYFDLDGDRQNEAISHVIADGCQLGCESSSLFYIHTADGYQPKLLWKIATGGDLLGGLKAVNFKSREINLEVFGDCQLENLVIKPNVDLKKNANLKTKIYTKFVFTLGENGFTQTARATLSLPNRTNIAAYRPKISFGEPD